MSNKVNTLIFHDPILDTAVWYNSGMPPVNLEFFDRYIRPTLESIKFLGDCEIDNQAKQGLFEMEQQLDWTMIGFMTGKEEKSTLYNDNTKDAREIKDFKLGYDIGLALKTKQAIPEETLEKLTNP